MFKESCPPKKKNKHGDAAKQLCSKGTGCGWLKSAPFCWKLITSIWLESAPNAGHLLRENRGVKMKKIISAIPYPGEFSGWQIISFGWRWEMHKGFETVLRGKQRTIPFSEGSPHHRWDTWRWREGYIPWLRRNPDRARPSRVGICHRLRRWWWLDQIKALYLSPSLNTNDSPCL